MDMERHILVGKIWRLPFAVTLTAYVKVLRALVLRHKFFPIQAN
jgi:hypothetical protein